MSLGGGGGGGKGTRGGRVKIMYNFDKLNPLPLLFYAGHVLCKYEPL